MNFGWWEIQKEMIAYAIIKKILTQYLQRKWKQGEEIKFMALPAEFKDYLFIGLNEKGEDSIYVKDFEIITVKWL